MWRSLNSNIRSLCQSHIKVNEVINRHYCAHVKDDQEEDTTFCSRHFVEASRPGSGK